MSSRYFVHTCCLTRGLKMAKSSINSINRIKMNFIEILLQRKLLYIYQCILYSNEWAGFFTHRLIRHISKISRRFQPSYNRTGTLRRFVRLLSASPRAVFYFFAYHVANACVYLSTNNSNRSLTLNINFCKWICKLYTL